MNTYRGRSAVPRSQPFRIIPTGSARRSLSTTGDLNALVEDLVAALDKFKAPEQEKKELLGLLGPMKKDIVELM